MPCRAARHERDCGGSAPIASASRSRYIAGGSDRRDCFEADPMRAEVQNLVDEIKQSIGLLRRHL
jgi:hypothetical protein